MATRAKTVTKRKAPAKATTAADVHEDAQVVLADLFRHAAGRRLNPEDPPKLPTRLRKLEGLDALPASAAVDLLAASPLLADLVLAALDRAGYVLERK